MEGNKRAKTQWQSQTQDICFELRATALLPAFTAVKGFHYPRALYKVYRRPKHRTPLLTRTSTEEVTPQEQEEATSNQVITTRSQNFLLTLSFTTSL